MIITGTRIPKKIGDVIQVVNSVNPYKLGSWRRGDTIQPCVVVREATIDEWVKQLEKENTDAPRYLIEQARLSARGAYFYEVATD